MSSALSMAECVADPSRDSLGSPEGITTPNDSFTSEHRFDGHLRLGSSAPGNNYPTHLAVLKKIMPGTRLRGGRDGTQTQLAGLLPAPRTLHPAPCTLHPAPCSLLPAPRSLLTVHRSPLTTHHSPLTTHHSPLATRHSPLTSRRFSPTHIAWTHPSPLATHHSPLTLRRFSATHISWT